jgi:predicted lysophospholipase L1 biosynthesis ABC-type transport system permease subunit
MIPLLLAARRLLSARWGALGPVLLASLCLCAIDLLDGHLQHELRQAEQRALARERLGHLAVLPGPGASSAGFSTDEAARARNAIEALPGVGLVVPIPDPAGQPAVARLAVYLSSAGSLAGHRAALASALQAAGVAATVRDGRDLSESYLNARAQAAFQLGCAAGAAIAVIGAVIWASMSVGGHKRRQDFAVLRALGMRPASLFGQMALEALLMAMCSLALGLLGSAMVAWTARRAGHLLPETHLAVELDPLRLLAAAAAVLAVAFLAALIPAMKAARTETAPSLSARELGGW